MTGTAHFRRLKRWLNKDLANFDDFMLTFSESLTGSSSIPMFTIGLVSKSFSFSNGNEIRPTFEAKITDFESKTTILLKIRSKMGLLPAASARTASKF